MTLPTPTLDDRRFQDLVDEAKRRVQVECPEWSDHNVSDPGVTLIELFAWMTEQVIYRLNQVPDRLHLKFLELIDVRPEPPQPARAEVTFRLSAAQPVPIEIPPGTVVATLRTGPDAPVTFTVTQRAVAIPCELARLVRAPLDAEAADVTDAVRRSEPVLAFGEVPQPGDSLEVELSSAVPACAVTLRFTCDEAYGDRIDPRRPPFAWEASAGGEWRACEWEDATDGLNTSGDVVVHVARAVGDEIATRLRCRVVEVSVGGSYRESPRIRGLEAFTSGVTAPVAQAELVRGELLGTADGQPGQRFVVARAPITASDGPLVVDCVHADGTEEEFVEREHLAASGPDDGHVAVDRSGGELTFGVAVREPGRRRPTVHGRVPPAGARLTLRPYLTGGGTAGNVPAGALSVLKSTIPTVSRVENRRAASGGAAGETLEEARARGALRLRVLERAVTAEDYERLARDASPDVRRVRCLPPSAEAPSAPARVLVVPRVTADPEALVPDHLRVPRAVAERVRAHLEERRVLGARFVVGEPSYVAVEVNALVRLLPAAEPKAVVERAAVAALHRWFHPTLGGSEGRGWPFGRPVYSGEAYLVLQRVRGVEIVLDLKLFVVGADGTQQPVQRVDVPADGLVLSYSHAVAAVEDR